MVTSPEQAAALAENKPLHDLIQNTESMDENEKQDWFVRLKEMNPEQIVRLFTILDTEREKLEELERKYQEEIKALNEKHLIEWNEFQNKPKKEEPKEGETVIYSNMK